MDENALRAAGIDYDAALARFMGKQAIYEKYLRKLPEDAHMDAAWTALEQQDDAELLEQVHAIKGLTGTLGITGLFEQSAAIVALLRAGTREGLQEKMTSLKQEWDRVCETGVACLRIAGFCELALKYFSETDRNSPDVWR